MRADRVGKKDVIAVTLISFDLSHDILKCIQIIVPVANRPDIAPPSVA